MAWIRRLAEDQTRPISGIPTSAEDYRALDRILIDGVGVALKTEANKSIKNDVMTISKLMESAWTKECKTIQDFLRGIDTHIIPRIAHSKYLFILRCHGRLREGSIRYELAEVPMEAMLAMTRLSANDCGPITKAGGTRCGVKYGGRDAYTLVFDGSDQKITVRNMVRGIFVSHAQWTLRK